MALAEKYWIDGLPVPGLKGNLAEKYWVDGLPAPLLEAAAAPPVTTVYRRTLSPLGTRVGVRQLQGST